MNRWWEFSEEDSAKLEEAKRAQEIALDRAKMVILEGWLDGYISGHVTLHNFCRGVVAAAKVMPDMGFTLVGGPDRLVGFAVRKAMESPPLKEGRKNAKPDSFKRMAAEAVGFVRAQEGLPINRSERRGKKSRTAFEQVALFFREFGVRGITPRNVEDWYQEYRDSGQSAGA